MDSAPRCLYRYLRCYVALKNQTVWLPKNQKTKNRDHAAVSMATAPFSPSPLSPPSGLSIGSAG
jgi:hypothetical protein